MSAPASAPHTDEDSAPYWEALSEHRILTQTCLGCGEVRCPPLPGCMNCGRTEADIGFASGEGHIYSWIVVRRPLGSITADEVPCTIATVELDEGFRLVGRLAGPTSPALDQPVRAAYVDHPGWTELRFATTDEGAA
jgi:uncharacterized OB-fold protein